MKPKKKSAFKKWISRLHLWLGLASGIIVFTVAVTGCIFVFHDEIKDLTRSHRKVEIQQESFVKPSNLQEKVAAISAEAVPGMVVYQGRDRSAFVYAEVEGEPTHFYFNPYTAEFLAEERLADDFFLIIEDLHMHLWLPETIGKQVVGISTLIFLFMLVSGLILWWPKKRKNLKKRLSIKWDAKWRRINYDWHSTTGFYLSLIAAFIALTGLSFSYEWMNSAFYETANLFQEKPGDIIEVEIASEEETVTALDLALYKTLELKPEDEMFFVWSQGPGLPIVSGSYPEALDYDGQSNFYFHPETGELLQKHNFELKSAGMKLQELSYGLHTGQYLDLPGKILAFFASLFIAGLPVSGFLIWYGRKYKNKRG
ncbi:PepSY-associated TM helix domain-containing protein [Salegentibacter sp. HM20]